MSYTLMLAILALWISIASIVLRYWETPPEALRRIAQLELDLAQSVETVSRWMKRENVRRARDEKEREQEPEPALTAVPGTGNKAALREKARARGLLR